VPLGERLVLWPRLSADFASVWQAQTGGPTFHHRILSSTLYLPVDAFLVPHLALGLGPAITQQILHRTDSGTEPRITTVQLLVEIAVDDRGERAADPDHGRASQPSALAR